MKHIVYVNSKRGNYWCVALKYRCTTVSNVQTLSLTIWAGEEHKGSIGLQFLASGLSIS